MAQIKVGTITKKQLLTIERAVSRAEEIEQGKRINHKRVWTSKKAYKRNPKHRNHE